MKHLVSVYIYLKAHVNVMTKKKVAAEDVSKNISFQWTLQYIHFDFCVRIVSYQSKHKHSRLYFKFLICAEWERD